MGQNPLKPINRLLIANRGEIACRIIRTAKRLGIHTIAVYATEDQHALHTTLADEAFCIGSGGLENSYLNIDHIIHAAKESGAAAIHPGYGFLSENAQFAKRCQQEKIIFIGPSANAIAKMAVKDEAKKIMREAQVPVVPGYEGTSQTVNDLEAAAKGIGFPLMLKAAKGGGGKGMRIVKEAKALKDAIESAKRESLASFNDDSLFIEKYLTDARHIEIQIFRDNHGNAVHLFERDCSLQRRHQKIIEESPALHIKDNIKQRLYNAAINAAHAIDYLGAGTIEFLYTASGEFYFMEMNTRLQVEHPVSEMITGLDLVEWQIRIAQGEALPLKQADIHCQGHAIEARIYAEDPSNSFLPATGRIKDIFLPQGLVYRLDSGIQVGDKIGIHFDPMLAKVIVHAPSREEARKALLSVLLQYHLVGISTNIPFLRNVLLNDEFIAGQIHTQTLEKSLNALLPKPSKPTLEHLAIAGLIRVLTRRQSALSEGDPYSLWNKKDAWRLNNDSSESLTFFCQGMRYPLTLTHLPNKGKNDIHCQVSSALFSSTLSIRGYLAQGKLEVALANYQTTIPYYCDDTGIEFIFLDQAIAFMLEECEHEHSLSDNEAHQAIRAPMPGIITKIWVKAGDKVSNGAKLLALEAMKMEHTLAAPKSAAIKAIRYDIGDQVEEGCELIDFE